MPLCSRLFAQFAGLFFSFYPRITLINANSSLYTFKYLRGCFFFVRKYDHLFVNRRLRRLRGLVLITKICYIIDIMHHFLAVRRKNRSIRAIRGPVLVLFFCPRITRIYANIFLPQAAYQKRRELVSAADQTGFRYLSIFFLI